MKLTKSKLKEIIKEEIKKILVQESEFPEDCKEKRININSLLIKVEDRDWGHMYQDSLAAARADYEKTCGDQKPSR